MSKNSISANNSETAYKPKTAVIGKDEIFDPDEFYYLEVSQHLFRGRVRPGEKLLMRKGCLATVRNMVQVASSDPLVCEIAEYQDGMEYSAVCVGRFIPDDLPQERGKVPPKKYYRAVYTVNTVKRYSPWFNSIANAFRAKDLVIAKHGCEAGVYFSYDPSSELTGPGDAA
jgi:hypothetical protein